MGCCAEKKLNCDRSIYALPEKDHGDKLNRKCNLQYNVIRYDVIYVKKTKPCMLSESMGKSLK